MYGGCLLCPPYSVLQETHSTLNEKKRGDGLNLCEQTAKFIDKLKPCKYSLTIRELKKQIFSNLQHPNQIAPATEIPLRLIIFPAITISDISLRIVRICKCTKQLVWLKLDRVYTDGRNN